MGYRSQVYLKTTTEGWILMKKMNDSIENPDNKPLQYATVERTKAGFYKITFDDIKWYDSYKQVQNFNRVLVQCGDQDIPYSFIRIGEDTDDVEHRKNWTDDMPDEIGSFEPLIDVNDESCGSYDEIMSDGKDIIPKPEPVDTAIEA